MIIGSVCNLSENADKHRFRKSEIVCTAIFSGSKNWEQFGYQLKFMPNIGKTWHGNCPVLMATVKYTNWHTYRQIHYKTDRPLTIHLRSFDTGMIWAGDIIIGQDEHYEQMTEICWKESIWK